MLGGLDPVIIFQFKVKVEDSAQEAAAIPFLSKVQNFISQPPIPVYLSEKTFNIAVGPTSKSVDFQTETQGATQGSAVGNNVEQNPIQSSIEFEITGLQNSIPLIILSALVDQAYEKASAKEYSISFLYGATTIFNAVLHSFTAETIENTNKLSIKIKLSKGDKQPTKTNGIGTVPGSSGTIPVGAA